MMVIVPTGEKLTWFQKKRQPGRVAHMETHTHTSHSSVIWHMLGRQKIPGPISS